MKNMSRHYEKLSGVQRVIVAVEAMARGDDEELEHLDMSCPRTAFTGLERSYVLGMTEMHRFALMYATEVMSRFLEVACLTDLSADRSRVDGLFEGDSVRRGVLMAEIAGLREAWVGFCASLGLDPLVVLKAFGISQLVQVAPVASFKDIEAVEQKSRIRDETLTFMSGVWENATSN